MADTTGEPNVLVIGAGPAGLAAATDLARRGHGPVIVIDRDTEPGGIPRHCGHSPFGLREFHRLLSGPAYAQRLTDDAWAAGVDLRTGHTAVTLHPGGAVDVASVSGVQTLNPRRVILATGIRETPRHARLVGGDRPLGVLSTGALQAMVYLKRLIPFRRPVIVGTELVSFSALLTCRHAGIRPVAMIEAGGRITARQPSGLLPRLLGVPLQLGTRVEAIHGEERVRAVTTVDSTGRRRRLDCDGVLFTGGFVPEATLVRAAGLDFDDGSAGPVVDQYGRCSDPAYFAAGNLLRPVETAGWSHAEGVSVARHVAADLRGELPPAERTVAITHADPVRLVVPQRMSLPAGDGWRRLQLRVDTPVRGELILSVDGRPRYRRRVSTRPERRLLLPLDMRTLGPAERLDVRIVNRRLRDSDAPAGPISPGRSELRPPDNPNPDPRGRTQS